MKLIKIANKATMWLSDGTMVMVDNFTDKDTEFVQTATDEEIKFKYIPEHKEYTEQIKVVKKAKELVKLSKLVELVDGKYIIPSLSKVSVPKYVVKRLVKAELDSDEAKVQAYMNFWTLSCQNPNEIARNNLLWFLETHGFRILKSGLFVAYRNVVTVTNTLFTDEEKLTILSATENIKKVQKKSPKDYYVCRDEEGVISVKHRKHLVEGEVLGSLKETIEIIENEDVIYTDKHTRKMKITLKSPVRLDRILCDESSDRSCSAGLHLAKKDWDGLGGFGDTTLMCLCNPTHVVAVPKEGTYGKIRTCEYFPVEVAEYDENRKIIENIEDGIELDYFNISYDGVINEKGANEFQIPIPIEPEIKYKSINKSLTSIKESLKKWAKIN